MLLAATLARRDRRRMGFGAGEPARMLLYHASSSYYSMIARLGLLEAGVRFETRRLDIHLAKEQLAPWYVAINPGMTVPSLVDGATTFTDSRDILGHASTLAGAAWTDADPALAGRIAQVVADHYAIAIEKLTFGSAFLKRPMMRPVFVHFLKRVVAGLQRSLATAANPEAVRHKIAVNEDRMAFFDAPDLAARVEAERAKVTNLLGSLPTGDDVFLFGDRPGSADVVVAVLLARLRMIGQYDALLAGHTGVDAWYARYRARDVVRQADLWERFQPLRILMKR